jgi:hypothetical protein
LPLFRDKPLRRRHTRIKGGSLINRISAGLSLITEADLKPYPTKSAQKNIEVVVETEEFSFFLLKMHVEFAFDNCFQYYKLDNVFYSVGFSYNVGKIRVWEYRRLRMKFCSYLNPDKGIGDENQGVYKCKN